MKKKLLLLLFFTISTLCFSNSSFLSYYNNPNNWDSNTVGQGTLFITTTVVTSEKYVLPNNIELRLIEKGELIASYDFSLTGNPNNPGEYDPQVIYSEKVKKALLIITNYLINS